MSASMLCSNGTPTTVLVLDSTRLEQCVCTKTSFCDMSLTTRITAFGRWPWLLESNPLWAAMQDADEEVAAV